MVAAKALRDEAASSELVGRRLLEFKANASPSSTQELVRLDHLEGDDPERFAAEMWEIHEDFGLPVLGCCGTDDRHMRALAARMAPTGSASWAGGAAFPRRGSFQTLLAGRTMTAERRNPTTSTSLPVSSGASSGSSGSACQSSP